MNAMTLDVRELASDEVGAVAGGPITISCCEVNLGPITISVPTFSVTIPDTDHTIGDTFRDLNNGNLR